MTLALLYGSPGFWLDPDLPDELLAAALDAATRHNKG